MTPDTVRVIQWPSVEPVTLAEAKVQLGMTNDQSEFDRFILDKLATARRLIESRLSMTMVATQYRATWKAVPQTFRLPAPPLLVDQDHPISISVDGDSLSSGQFEIDLDAMPGEITLDSGISGKAVVEYWAGVPAGQQICPMLRSAVLCYVTHCFENRGVLAADSAIELPQAFETLLAASSWNGGW